MVNMPALEEPDIKFPIAQDFGHLFHDEARTSVAMSQANFSWFNINPGRVRSGQKITIVPVDEHILYGFKR
jgi:hypothetical protein